MAAHLGHRDNPVVVRAPGDLDRACARVWQPTPEQAAAGNYKMAHAIIGGLPVAIETPKDRVRSGIGPDGTPWIVTMASHYGYFKRSEGADGDSVDVYVGPEAHRAESLPVYAVDQCDADSKAFDEHKIMIGFPDGESARNAYYSAFSDGRGPDRAGGVTRMTFEQLKSWLKSNKTKKPFINKSAFVAIKKSVSNTASCGCKQVKCGCVKFGDDLMTEPTAKAITPKEAGWFSSIFAKGLTALSPTERAEFAADAAAKAGVSLGKASDMMMAHTGEMSGLDQHEDQWDGPPDDRLDTVSAHGPDSSVAGGKTPVGPTQAASGNGAEKMEGQYSRPAPQTGVQLATERLGKEIAGMRGAMKAIIATVKSQGDLIGVLQLGTSAPAVPDAAAIGKMIEDAVAKAVAPFAKSIAKVEKNLEKAVLAKAESESEKGEDDEEDEEDEEATESESGEGVEIEIDNDVEDEDDDETGKAVRFRQMAKNRIKFANRRFGQAEEFLEEGKSATARRRFNMAKANIAKAEAYLTAAKSLAAGKSGTGTAKVERLIAKAKSKKVAMNQDKWPNKGAAVPTQGAHAAQAGVSLATGNVALDALQKAAADIQRAASGMTMLTTTANGLFEAMGSQSRGSNLPPAIHVALAKGGDPLVAKTAEITQLMMDGDISYEDLDNAKNVIALAKSQVPEEFLKGKISLLPDRVREIMTRAA